MGIILCCFGARDPPQENSNASDSTAQVETSATEIRSNYRSVDPSININIPTGCESVEQESLVKLLAPVIEEEIYEFLFSDDENVCPTCLQGYDFKNPKMITRCCHHFHLACIYEWKERSEMCPVCFSDGF